MSYTFLGKKNNAHTTLALPITSTGQLTLDVQPGASGFFPATAFHGTLYTEAAGIDLGEIVTATYSSGDTFTIVRAQEGTSAQTWVADDTIFTLEVTAAQIVELETAINTNAGNIATNTTNISTNTANISTNTTNIATNTTAIAAGWVAVSGSWSYASADSPTFTITVPSNATLTYSPGMRIRLTQTTVKYFIVTAVSATVLTVYGGTDYTLANAAISAISYSPFKAPFGFPLDPVKWSVTLTDSSNHVQSSPSAATWYNVGSLSISVPIGIWDVSKSGAVGATNSAGTLAAALWTLSTANNTESDHDFTSGGYVGTLSANYFAPHFTMKPLTVAAKTTYYLNVSATGSVSDIEIVGAQQEIRVVLRSVYL